MKVRAAALALLVAAAPACGKTDSSASAAPKPMILVVPKGSTHEYWRTVRVGASEEAAALGVQFQWPSAFGDNDLEAQWLVLDQARAVALGEGHPMGVALAPQDREAFVEPARTLQDAGIPVVIFDTELAGDDFVTSFSTDNERAGRAAGEEMVRQLGGRGNVAILRVNPLTQSTRLREKGFLEVIAQQPGIAVVSKDLYASGLVERAFQKGLELLADLDARAITLDGVFCPNESTSTGMLRALESLGRSDRVKLVGVDRTQRLVNALWTGHVAALVVQDPYLMGRRSVRALVEYLKHAGELQPLRLSHRAEYDIRLRAIFPHHEDVPFRVVTRETMVAARAFAQHEGFDDIGPYVVSQLISRENAMNAELIDVLRLVFPKVAIVH